MQLRPLLLAVFFALAVSAVSADAAQAVWSGLVIAENVPQPTPIPPELTKLEGLYDRERRRFAADAKAAEAVSGPTPAGIDAADLAAVTLVSNVILNLDEFLTKE